MDTVLDHARHRTGTVNALSYLNAEVQYDILDSELGKRGDFRWYNRSLQEFFAAYWLAKYAESDDLENLRAWRYDSWDEEKASLYGPLWGYLAEMPRAVWQKREAEWVSAVGVLFEARDGR